MSSNRNLPGRYPSDSPPTPDDQSANASPAFPSYLSDFVGQLFSTDDSSDEVHSISPIKSGYLHQAAISPHKSIKPLSDRKTKQDHKKPRSTPKKMRVPFANVISSATPAVVPFKRPLSTSSAEEDAPTMENADVNSSIIDIIREHFTSGLATETENEPAPRRMPKPSSSSSGIVREYRKNRTVLEKPKIKLVTASNVVQDLFNSELMDIIEWRAAEARRTRITEDPHLTSLDNIEAELQEQLCLIDMMPKKYGGIIIRSEDLYWPTVHPAEEDVYCSDKGISSSFVYDVSDLDEDDPFWVA